MLVLDASNLFLLNAVYLNHNVLTVFPKSVFTVRRLRFNSKVPLCCFPSHYRYHYLCRKLYLNSNQLTALPAEVDSLVHLQVLALSSNHLEDLPDVSSRE